DEATREYFDRLGRASDWRPLAADPDAEYDEEVELDLSALEPLVALPGSPGRVVPGRGAGGTPLEPGVVGSRANSSREDTWAVAHAIRGKRVASALSLGVCPGSARILEIMAREGLLADLLAAGAIVSEPTCGSCAGIGHVPATGTKSLRAFNRNFPGRSGTRDDAIYLCSPVTAAVSALSGVITDPRVAGGAPPPPADRPPAAPPGASMPGRPPPAPASEVEQASVIKGPNIKDVPRGAPVPERLAAPVLIKLGDKVSTDDISPSGTQALMFRMNVPAISEFCFKNVDPEFVTRAKAAGIGVIVGGEHYGQGSSREAAVLSPLYLGVRLVLAKSFARLHRANLINWGLVPLE